MRGATVVRAVAAALAAIAFVSGFSNVLRSVDQEHSAATVRGRVLEHPADGLKPRPLRFLMTVTRLNPVERRIEATLTMFPRDLPRLVDQTGTPVEEAGELRPEFADAKLTITLAISDLGDTVVDFPLKSLAPQWGGDPRLSVSVPAAVDPAQFPNDDYALDLLVDVHPPPGLRVEPPPGSPDHGNTAHTLPVVFGVALDDRLGQWTLDTGKGVGSSGGTTFEPVAIKAHFRRGWSDWAFIYSVSLMPAVIGLSFFVRTRRRRGDTSAAMELAAALLALIALRQVFVPTDITGLTRLDFLLGVQLLAVCWLMAVTYVADSPRRPTSPSPRPRRRRMTPRLPDGAIRNH